MHITVACIHCGKLLRAPQDLAGKVVRCVDCLKDFVLPTAPADPAPAAGTRSSSARSVRPRDETLSRSMLAVSPGMEPAPTEELLCRLEPKTLRWIVASDGLQEFLGATIEQLRPKSFAQFLHPDDRALAQDEFRHAIELGERHDFVLRIRGADGSWHYMRFYTQARYDPDGRLNHIRCVLKDVTDRIRAEQELRRRTEQLTAANQQLRRMNEKLKETQSQLVHSEKLAALGTLAAGMAHEINNPLAFASNNVAVLERELAFLLQILARYQQSLDVLRTVVPELAEQIARLQDEADLPYLQENLPRMTQATRRGLSRVAQIVQNLRGFAHLDRAEVAEIDVNESIDQSLGMLGDVLARHQIHVERDYEPLPRLEGAGAHLNQVFLNLLMNALQAIESAGRGSGRLQVTTRHSGAEVVVEIADDGCGIPPDVLPRIFDPFFTTKPIGCGSGLGLSISHGIVAEHGGRIEVESTAGVGSRFQIHLPIRRPSARPPAPSTESKREAT